MADEKKPTKNLITPDARLCFPSVFAPRAFGAGKPKYSAVLNFGKIDPKLLAPLKEAARKAVFDKWGAKPPSNLRNPFRDGADKEHLDGFTPGDVYITVSSEQAPGIVDRNVQPIIDQRDLYPGVWVKASVRAFCYDQQGNKGVSFGLRNIMKLRDDTPLGSFSRPEDDFVPADPDAGATESDKGAGALFD